MRTDGELTGPTPPGHRDPLPAGRQRGAGRRGGGARAPRKRGRAWRQGRGLRGAPPRPPTLPHAAVLTGPGPLGADIQVESILRRASRFSCFSFASRRDSFCSREDAAIFPAAAAAAPPPGRPSVRQTNTALRLRLDDPAEPPSRSWRMPGRAPALPACEPPRVRASFQPEEDASQARGWQRTHPLSVMRMCRSPRAPAGGDV